MHSACVDPPSAISRSLQASLPIPPLLYLSLVLALIRFFFPLPSRFCLSLAFFALVLGFPNRTFVYRHPDGKKNVPLKNDEVKTYPSPSFCF